ncbi:MAG: carbohydrate binding domain-containing protein [Isosphaeraceae bacterium]
MPRHCTRNLLIALGLALVSWVIPCAMGADHPPLIPFVLPWDDDAPTVTDVRRWLPDEAPAGKNGPVVVRDGHLFSGAKRLRLVGVNVCFGANFPEHEDARKVAARMAKFGINAVRFHHMDNQTAPSGIWSRDRKTLDPKQLDRLDFFFAELKRNGIYADLNLHVSRDYPDRPRWDRMPSYFKGVDNFDPDMIAFQKEYAKALLTHKNPYTGLRYADDPGVAIVEINNENALTHEWFSGQLDAMPDSYGRLLAERWNAWLTDRYKDDATLRRIWEVRSTPLFSEMIANGRFTRMMESWNLERHEGAEATANVIVVGPSRAALMIDVPHAAKQAWHVQVNQRGIQVRSNWPYTISFLARAEKPRTMNVNVMQSHEPWRQLWSTEVDLTPEFRRFNLVLQSAEDERFARLGFSDSGVSRDASRSPMSR